MTRSKLYKTQFKTLSCAEQTDLIIHILTKGILIMEYWVLAVAV